MHCQRQVRMGRACTRLRGGSCSFGEPLMIELGCREACSRPSAGVFLATSTVDDRRRRSRCGRANLYDVVWYADHQALACDGS